MKMYADNKVLAGQLLETAFALLRNEGRQPADVMALAYNLLVGGIDVTTVQQSALRDYLRDVLANHDNQVPATPARSACNARNDSRGDLT
jgi:hypothetical protein